MKPNDSLLNAVAKIAVLIILTFSINLFFGGHHNPGGGFIGGLGIASAIVLMYLTHGTDAVRKLIPVDLKTVAAVGVLIAVLTGMGSFLFGVPFLSQTFGYFTFPVLGKVELATALIFDLGVALAVIGSTITIILSISEDR